MNAFQKAQDDGDSNAQEADIELQQEFWSDSDDYARSDEDGWPYAEREGAPEDNIIDQNARQAPYF